MVLTWNCVEDDATDDDEDDGDEQLNDGDHFVAQRVNQSLQQHRVELLPVQHQPRVTREVDAERWSRDKRKTILASQHNVAISSIIFFFLACFSFYFYLFYFL